MRRTANGARGGVRPGSLTRRDFLKRGGAGLAGAALLGSGALAGCGGGGGSSASGDVVISFGPDDTGTLPKLIKKFNDGSKGFKVRYREMSSDTGQYFDQLRTEFQAGGGDIDVIIGDVIWPAQFAETGYVLDLSDLFTDTDEFLPGPMQAATYQGKPYAVPWYTDAGLLYYRKDLLEKAGYSEAPKTWEELKEMSAKITRDGGAKYGYVFQGAEYEGGVCNQCEYVWTHGGDVLDPNDPSKVVIDSPEAAAGYATARSMIGDGASPQAVLQYKEDESHAAFLRGDSVFIRNWPYMYALVANPEESEIEPGQVDVAEIPVGEGQSESYSTLGGWNFLINAQTDKQEQAWEVVRFLTAPEQLKTNALQGSKLPPRKSLYDDREILEKVPVARLGQDAIIGNSRPRPVSPFYSDISLEIAKQFNASLSGDLPPEEAVATLQKDLQSIVEEGQQATS